MFNTHEIPRDQWASCLSWMDHARFGEPTLVWFESMELGHQPVAGPMPLLGLSYIEKGSEACAFDLLLGERDDPMSHLSHRIHDPEKVYLQETEDGSPKCLWVDSKDKSNTLVCFDPSIVPVPGTRTLTRAGSRPEAP